MYSISGYGSMIEDRVRMAAYEEALRAQRCGLAVSCSTSGPAPASMSAFGVPGFGAPA